MLIFLKCKSALDKLQKQLSSKFEIKDHGEATKVLGMETERDQKVARFA